MIKIIQIHICRQVPQNFYLYKNGTLLSILFYSNVQGINPTIIVLNGSRKFHISPLFL